MLRQQDHDAQSLNARRSQEALASVMPSPNKISEDAIAIQNIIFQSQQIIAERLYHLYDTEITHGIAAQILNLRADLVKKALDPEVDHGVLQQNYSETLSKIHTDMVKNCFVEAKKCHSFFDSCGQNIQLTHDNLELCQQTIYIWIGEKIAIYRCFLLHQYLNSSFIESFKNRASLEERDSKIIHERRDRLNMPLNCYKDALTMSVTPGHQTISLKYQLIQAIYEGNLQFMQSYIENPPIIDGHRPIPLKERIDQYISKGKTMLHLACLFGQVDMVSYLLQKGARQILSQEEMGNYYPIHDAVKLNHPATVQILDLLLAHWHNKIPLAKIPGIYNRTPLHTASLGDNLAGANWLLLHGADINAQETDQGTKVTPLHEAARRAGEALINLFLDKGADMMAKNKLDERPIFVAALEGRDSALVCFMRRGCCLTVSEQLNLLRYTRGDQRIIATFENAVREYMTTLYPSDSHAEAAAATSIVSVSLFKPTVATTLASAAPQPPATLAPAAALPQ